jgi:hypothetical protein
MKLTKNIVLVTNYRFKMAIIFFAVWFYSPTLVADFITLIKADQCTNIVEMFIQEKSIRITFELGEPDF